MKGYKATNKDMTCLGYQYELGKEHVFDGPIKICKNGFHYCDNLDSVMDHYRLTPASRYFEVEIPDDADVVMDDTLNARKFVTNKIKFIRELTNDEISVLTNGDYAIGVDSEGLTYYKRLHKVCYYDEDGCLHREDGPAEIYNDGVGGSSQHYYKHGMVHREDGPAVSDHRVIKYEYDGNEIIITDITKSINVYYVNGVLHREDGPAIIDYRNGEIIEQNYFIDGNFLTEEEFNTRSKS